MSSSRGHMIITTMTINMHDICLEPVPNSDLGRVRIWASLLNFEQRRKDDHVSKPKLDPAMAKQPHTRKLCFL